ncbi:MAG: CehA/McbA family metallohydrolase [Bryobacterales bacterium]|nr:CehA/McbA family metallohydrolase [Bryobacterales bacterium]
MRVARDLAMRAIRVRIGLFFVAVIALVAGTVRLPSQGPALHWYKGNLHSHTINSDGDSAPDAVTRWYKERRYHFLALTDHNYFTDPQGLDAFLGAKDRFLLITGEEVTSHYGDAPVHVNAFRLQQTIEPFFGEDILSTLQGNVDAIQAAGAVPSLNHPQDAWAIDAATLVRVRNLGLFEVYNSHPDTNNEWGLEEMWDSALTAGRKLYGIAVDDAHEFKQFGPGRSNPGGGWVEVLAPELSEQAILAAVGRGEFYASTGVKLEAMRRGAGQLRVKIKQESDRQYRTVFVGKAGRVLARETGVEVSYRLQPGDGYVRATITDSNGRKAWVQPVFPVPGS